MHSCIDHALTWVQLLLCCVRPIHSQFYKEQYWQFTARQGMCGPVITPRTVCKCNLVCRSTLQTITVEYFGICEIWQKLLLDVYLPVESSWDRYAAYRRMAKSDFSTIAKLSKGYQLKKFARNKTTCCVAQVLAGNRGLFTSVPES